MPGLDKRKGGPCACQDGSRAASRVSMSPASGTGGVSRRGSMARAARPERSHRGLVQRFAKPPCGVTCIEGSNPSLSASRHSVAGARSSVDRALGCGPKGREFESRRARQHHKTSPEPHGLLTEDGRAARPTGSALIAVTSGDGSSSSSRARVNEPWGSRHESRSGLGGGLSVNRDRCRLLSLRSRA